MTLSANFYDIMGPGNGGCMELPMIMHSPQESQVWLGSSAGSYSGTLDTSFYPEPSHMNGWSKVEYGPQSDLPPFSTLTHPHYRRASEEESLSSPGEPFQTIVKRAARSVPRTRQPRKLTTKEDANFQCQIKGCGKLFGRSYNFKAHMETHDARREYPFPCPLDNCAKKFVRKTDLLRHHQSVHMKLRNFECDYCSRFFARKDTLRRHMEDGCSKRFDIETVDFRPAAYPSVMDIPSEHPRSASYSSMHFPSPHNAPQAMPSPYLDRTPHAMSSPYLDRPPYITEHAHQESVWSH